MLAHPEKSPYRQFFEQLLELFRDGKRFQHDGRLGPSGRERRVHELEERLERLCSRWQDELSDEAPTDERDFVNLQKALMRMRSEQELFTFVLVPEVEPTNNRSERTFRFTARMRHANQTSKSQWGAQRRSILTSVLLSLRQHLRDFTLEAVVQEVTRWRKAGESLFRAQLAAFRAGLPPPRSPRSRTVLMTPWPRFGGNDPSSSGGAADGAQSVCRMGNYGPGRRLESGWEIPYNRALRCVHSDFVVIRSRRAPMSRLPLTPDQAELSDRIYQSLRQAADADLRLLADLLASKPDRQLLGQTEFEVRDRVHRIGAKALETALDERKKGATKAPA